MGLTLATFARAIDQAVASFTMTHARTVSFFVTGTIGLIGLVAVTIELIRWRDHRRLSAFMSDDLEEDMEEARS